jgi:rod shape determining protein RodA
MAPKRGKMDLILLITVVIITVIGVLSIYSATYNKIEGTPEASAFVYKQCISLAIGFTLLLIVANLDYLRIIDYGYVFYGITLVLLLLVHFFAGERLGARRWFDLGFFSFQPSEFVKISTVLALSFFLGGRKDRAGSLDNYLYALMLVAPAFFLIFLQPDLGTAMILVPILFGILFICNENLKYTAITWLLGLLAMPVFWNFLKDYQRKRIMIFLNPLSDPLGAGYTIIQSKIAVGSGGLIGKGWLNGTQSHLKFIPEKHTDFIFCVFGEEWGFFGALFLLSLYAIVVLRGIKIIFGTDDVYGKAIATGIVSLIVFQIAVNISMTIGFMPVVGIPLPLVSYGGSNAIVTLLSVGFLLSISRRRTR